MVKAGIAEIPPTSVLKLPLMFQSEEKLCFDLPELFRELPPPLVSVFVEKVLAKVLKGLERAKLEEKTSAGAQGVISDSSNYWNSTKKSGAATKTSTAAVTAAAPTAAIQMARIAA